MPSLRLRPDSDHLSTPELDRVRARAEDLALAEDWDGLRAMRRDLENDAEWWPDLWGPLIAIAGQRVGDPAAIGLLARLVDGGFDQPGLFGGELEAAFAADSQWPGLVDQMALNAPATPLVLTQWPVLTPAAPLGLLGLPDRAAELRALLPAPAASAWQTAQATLDWVTHRWKHANGHMEIDDAVECLRRVDEGQRFSCVEYSLVLAQALNALGLPARRLWLRQDNYQTGISRAHVVAEAWIDDLSRWVVLDGHNGLYWTGEDGAALGVVALQQAVRSGDSGPAYVTFRDDFDETGAQEWFRYFANVSTTAGSWGGEPYGLVFQRTRLVTTGRLEHGPEAFYPDLSELGVQAALDDDGRPALRLSTAHPYATGFAIDQAPLNCELLVLDTAPGDHEYELAVRTRYGILAGHTLRYRVEQ
jgi:Transglutaminase-like superfamily